MRTASILIQQLKKDVHNIPVYTTARASQVNVPVAQWNIHDLYKKQIKFRF